ncbi:GLPGLI family protein [Chishuiella changwenlii]|uniref:GLPGLI family protein n=2 Tax=Chishuiella changwenlii TaxID=1434701 RepID=A0A1M7BDJ1_9FLAO|nr:GLPGLI family protein [Chishuiella changwenlii]SHL53095.1 GLPGLI family protein [Chishuiella changwenlii]
MKKIILLFILVSSFMQAQFYEVSFDVQVQTHYNEKGLKWFEEWEEDPKDRQILIELNKNPPVENYKFIFDENFSSSTHETRINNSQTEQNIFVSKFAPTFGKNAFIDYKENKFWANTDVYDDKYLAYDSIYKVNFQDTGKTKEILGIKVKEAVAKQGKYDLIAWYAPSIKYNYSPDIFYGTNGLILELHYKFEVEDEGEVLVSWKSSKIKPLKKNSKLVKPTKGKVVKFSELNAVWEEANNKLNALYNDNDGVDKK